VQAGQFKILNVAGVNLSVISYILYSREKPLSQAAQEFLQLLRGAANNNNILRGAQAPRPAMLR
jgi:hypothetical protein